jgi:hypothetical protein
MWRPRISDEDDDQDVFENGILRDAAIFRNRMSMKDAMRERPRVHDGHGGVVGTRPGFVISDVNRDQIRRAYLDYERDLISAYKDQPAGAYPYAAHLEGTACTINGWPGHLRKRGDVLVCVPDNGNDDNPDLEEAQSDSVKDHSQKMQQLYAAYDADLSQQWRRKMSLRFVEGFDVIDCKGLEQRVAGSLPTIKAVSSAACRAAIGSGMMEGSRERSCSSFAVCSAAAIPASSSSNKSAIASEFCAPSAASTAGHGQEVS